MPRNRLKDYALVIIATIVFSLLSILSLGILELLVLAILASVIGYAITKFHYRFIVLVCAFPILIAALFTWDVASAVSYMLPSLLCGISLGVAYNLKIKESKIISVLTCIYTFYLVINISILGTNSKGQNIIQEAISESSDIYQEILKTAYAGQIASEEIDTMMSAMLTTITKLIPAFIIIACISIAVLYFSVFKSTLKRAKYDTTIYSPFSAWHADKSFSIMFLIVAALCFLSPVNDYFGDVLANAVVVSGFIFFIFGLAYINFLLMRFVRNTFLRRVILVFITFSSLFTIGLPFIALLIIGIADGLVDFRKKSMKNNLPE